MGSVAYQIWFCLDKISYSTMHKNHLLKYLLSKNVHQEKYPLAFLIITNGIDYNRSSFQRAFLLTFTAGQIIPL